MKSAFVNWKTTLAGVITFLMAILPQISSVMDTDPSTAPDWNIVVMAISALFGLLFARDADKSSEDQRN